MPKTNTKEKEQNVDWDENNKQRIDEFFESGLYDVKNLLVVGDRGSGKTGIVYYILSQFNRRRLKFIYHHPRPEIIDNLEQQVRLGFRNLYDMGEINKAIGHIIWIDEIQKFLRDNTTRKGFIDLLTVLRQYDITVILSTCATRSIDAELESYIDVYIIKDIDYSTIKMRSKIRDVIKDYWTGNPKNFRLNQDEYLFYSRKFNKYNSTHMPYSAPLPHFWTDWLSKPFGSFNKVSAVQKQTNKPNWYRQ